MAHHFHPSILREYDIRGVVGETLNAPDAYAIGRSFGTIVRRTGGQKIVVGYDGRLSSPTLEHALVEGLCASGIDVIRIGLCATPTLYYAEASKQDVVGGIQVTGSHNPPNHNGFKIVLHGLPFFAADLQRLGEIAAAGDWLDMEGQNATLLQGSQVRDIASQPLNAATARLRGTVDTQDILTVYIDRISQALDTVPLDALSRMRIGWDAGNGAGGLALVALTQRLPGEHHLLYPQVDGRFPNHHPDPTIPENLADLRDLVLSKHLDFGVAFDGDADRIGVIDGQGRIIDADQLMVLFAQDVLPHHEKAPVVIDIKASQIVHQAVTRLHGQPLLARSGHAHIKSKMKETNAILGGETSGHINFADHYYGFDDALYAALRLIAAVHRQGQTLAQWRDALPTMVNTPELRFAVPASAKFTVIEEVRARLVAAGAEVNTLDGVRVSTPDGWWLLRASNTQEALTARAESDSAQGLARLLTHLDVQLALSGISRSTTAPH